MISAIYKFPLKQIPLQAIALPRHSLFLHAGIDHNPFGNGSLALWYSVNTGIEKEERRVRILPTGEIHLPEEPMGRNTVIGRHLATVVVPPFQYPTGVWHIFDAT